MFMIMKMMENEGINVPRLALDNRAGRGQKYVMKRMIPALLLVVLCGCGPSYNYSPYIGQQQNWQTQPGANVKIVDNATLYPQGTFPNRPYIIMGSVTTDNENNVAKAVREQHADAALIYVDRKYRTGTVAVAGPGVIWNVPLTGSQVNAQLIKFK
jgi:hypothetical protein